MNVQYMFVICTCIEYDMISCTQANCTENQSQSVILSTQFVAKILHFASCKVQSVNCEKIAFKTTLSRLVIILVCIICLNIKFYFLYEELVNLREQRKQFAHIY